MPPPTVMPRHLASVPAVCLVLLAASASAQSVWTGSQGTGWHVPANWSTNAVPDAATDVVVPPAPHQPSSFLFDPQCRDLSIEPGATLALGAGFDLFVHGDLDAGGTLAVSSSSSALVVAGAWQNDGTFVGGGCTLELTGDGTLAGASPIAVGNLVVSGGARVLALPVSVAADVTVEGAAQLTLLADLTVAANWTSSAAASDVLGAGFVTFTGDGLLTSGANALPNVRVAGGLRRVNPSAVAGRLEMSSGELRLLDGVTFAVGGDAELGGGTLSFEDLFPGPAGALDVAGDVTIGAAAGPFDPGAEVRCGGDWSSSAAFAPLGGAVVLAGDGTLGGAPSFADLRIASGTRDASVGALVRGDLSVENGALLRTTAAFDVDGAVVLGASATWELGSASHSVGGDWSSAGGSASGVGAIVFDGPGSLATGAGSIANVLVSAGERSVLGANVDRDLGMIGGALVVQPQSTLVVGDDLLLAAGTLSLLPGGPGPEIVDVGDDVAILASAGAFGPEAQIRCGGDWIAGPAFQPAAGRVRLLGAGATSVAGSSLVFFDLSVEAGTKTFLAPFRVDGAFTLFAGATLVTQAPGDFDGTVTLGNASAAWDVGSSTHAVAGDLFSNGASALGAGMLDFDGTGVVLSAGDLPHVRVSAGTRTFIGAVGASIVDVASLALSGGELVVGDDAAIRVAGDAELTGGTLSFASAAPGFEVLQVAGDVTLAAAAGAMSATSAILCGGDWSSTAAWDPPAGTVRLQPLIASTVSGSDLRFANLTVASGAVSFASGAHVAGDLAVSSGAQLTTAAALDVDGGVALGDATAAWNVGGATHDVAGAWASAGANAVGSGTIRFDGDGTLATGGGLLPSVVVAAGDRLASDATVAGDLALLGGSLTLLAGEILHVTGDGTFGGGALHFALDAAAVLDVDGDVAMTIPAGAMTAASVLRCGGDWSSSAAFAPLSGVVVLDGASSATVGGAAPAFADLVVFSGVKTTTAPVHVAGDLTVQGGASLVAGAPIEVDGDASLGGSGATWDTGGLTHVVHGDYVSSGGSATGGGTLRFEGAGALTTGGGTVPNVTLAAGTRAVGDAHVTGDLVLEAGELALGVDALLRVDGDAALLAGTLSWPAAADGTPDAIDVEGDVLVTAAAGATSADSELRCAGDWTSTGAFAPADGAVVLDGVAPTTVGGAGLTLATLVVQTGERTLVDEPTLDALVVRLGGTLAAAADVNTNSVLVEAGTLALGARTIRVAHDWDSSAPGSATTGEGFVRFGADGSVATGAGTIPNVLVAAGVRSVAGAAIDGDLALAGGVLRILDGATLSVAGVAGLTAAGSLVFVDDAPGPETLDVEKGLAAFCSMAGSSANSRIECAGDWLAAGTFLPFEGVVVFDGDQEATIAGADLDLVDVRFAAGTKTLAVQLSVERLAIESGATLVAGAAVAVSGDVTLGDGSATWALGGLEHVVTGDWSAAGGSASGGTIVFDGAGTLDTGGGTIERVRVVAGQRRARTSTVETLLELSGGELFVEDDQVLSVLGDAAFSGGVLSWEPVAAGADDVLDVEGDVTCTAAAGTTSERSVLRCAGDWSSNGSFAPASGRVELDGGATTAVVGLAPGADPTFAQLVVKGGTRTAANEQTLVLDAWTIEAGATYAVEGVRVTVPGGPVLAQGTLSIGAGGELALAPGVAVQVPGTLRVVGTVEDAAAVGGAGGGGYLLNVVGTLAASNFRFEEPGPTGIVVDEAATIAAAPHDLRGGTFARPSASPESVLLDLRRSAPTDVRYVAFEDPLGVGTYNVRVLSGSPVRFVNATGTFAGPAFEHDPFGLVAWDEDSTTVVSFDATAAADEVALAWTSTLEVDLAAYVVRRTPVAGGATVDVATLPAVGPSAYAVVDDDVLPQVKYLYELVERKTHGLEVALAQDTATPWTATAPPSNFLTVGPTGAFPDVQSAIAAASGPTPVIAVAAGTYPSFLVPSGKGTLRILADGSGPVRIDTTLGAVRILGVGPQDAVELSDLEIGDAASPFGGLLVRDCAGVIVLDELLVQGGTGQPGIDVDSSTRTAIQRTDAFGSPGLLLQDGAVALASRGTVDVLELRGFSSARVAELAGATVVETGSTLVTYPGPMADVEVAELLPLGEPFTVALSGTPSGIYVLVVAGGLGWLDIFPSPPWEMVGLIRAVGPPTPQILVQGQLDPSGSATVAAGMPPDGVLFGLPIVLSSIVVQTTPLVRLRWSNVASIIGVD